MNVVEDAADVPTQAWDEGYDVGHRDGCLNWSADNSTNPYRAEMLRLEERRAVAASTDIPAMCPIDHPHVASLMTPRPTTPYGLCAECHRMDWHRVTCSFHDPAVNEHDALVARVAEVRAYIERLRELTRPGCPDPRDDGSACGACRARWAMCDDLDAILNGEATS